MCHTLTDRVLNPDLLRKRRPVYHYATAAFRCFYCNFTTIWSCCNVCLNSIPFKSQVEVTQNCWYWTKKKLVYDRYLQTIVEFLTSRWYSYKFATDTVRLVVGFLLIICLVYATDTVLAVVDRLVVLGFYRKLQSK